MSVALNCDDENPGKCSRQGWGSGHWNFIATDYETFYMVQSCIPGDGSTKMKAFYVGVSEPLQVGTPEYEAWYEQMIEVLAEKRPDIDITEMWEQKQPDYCKY